ncbi:MAG: NAD(P)H-dependent oxidoreductase [Flavobacteriales bacterium]
MPRKKILAICGSTKSQSSSLSILKYIQNQYAQSLDVSIFDSIDKLPHFNPDLDNMSDLPNAIRTLRLEIDQSDGIIVCTPEYVFSMPGSLKNLLEWQVSTTLFSGKPVAMIVAAASGKKAYEALELVLTTIEVVMPQESRLQIMGAKGKVDEYGNIIDPLTSQAIERVVESLSKCIALEVKMPTKFES